MRVVQCLQQCEGVGGHIYSEFFRCCSSVSIVDHSSTVTDVNICSSSYNAMSKAKFSVTTKLGTFASAFTPIDDTAAGLKLARDLVGLGFTLAAAPIWNSGESSLPSQPRPANLVLNLQSSQEYTLFRQQR